MASRIPSLNWLRVFESAARTESFARAGEELHLSAAAVSQQIKALEQRLGTPLFHRGAHSVTLTDLGRSYLPSVQQSLGMLEEATQGVFGAHRDNPVFVQSVLLFAHGILSQGIDAFQVAHPNVTVTLTTANASGDFRPAFSDMQIVFGPPGALGRDYDPLIPELLFPVARPELADQITAPQDLMNHRLIDVSSHRAGWRHVLHALDLPYAPMRMLYADSSIMAAAFAAAGAGIMLARAPASDLVVTQSGLVPCLSDVAVPGQDSYHLVCADRAALRPAARAFRNWLLEYVTSFDISTGQARAPR